MISERKGEEKLHKSSVGHLGISTSSIFYYKKKNLIKIYRDENNEKKNLIKINLEKTKNTKFKERLNT